MTTGEKPTIQLPQAPASSSALSPRKRYLAMSGVLILLAAGVISLAMYYPSASGPVSSPAALQPEPSTTSSPGGDEPGWIPLTQVADKKIKVSYAVVGQTFKLKFLNEDVADVKIKYRLTLKARYRDMKEWKDFDYEADIFVKKGRHAFDNYPFTLIAEELRDVVVEITDWEY
jgi:hypothetical protein